jgi:hypothetical protein
MCAAGWAAGARLVDEVKPQSQPQPPPLMPLCRDDNDGYNARLGMGREDRRHWIDSYKKW